MKTRRPRRSSRGFTLVEVLIGLVVSLFIVLAATTLLAQSCGENRKLLAENNATQELRNSLDLIAHSIRRAGYWAAADGNVAANPNADFAVVSATSNDSITLRLTSSADASSGRDETIGFRVNGGAIETLLGDGRWQALTDAQTVTITRLSLRASTQSALLDDACLVQPNPSPDPSVQIRSVDIELTGRAAADAEIIRTLRTSVRVRNDAVRGSCAS